MKLPHPPLLVITDRLQARGDIPQIAAEAFDGGCRWISLREKDLPQTEQSGLLKQLLWRARAYSAVVTLHGDPRLARDSGAHGVHLPAGSDVACARRILGPNALIGLSIHSADEARQVDPAVTDYVIAGPVFATASKPDYGPALGVEGISRLVRASASPLLAIGGISMDSAQNCIAAGAAGIAVMGSVMRAPDPAQAMTTLIAAMIRKSA